jgi:hypothetical protein
VRPEQALGHAQQELERMRAAGAYSDVEEARNVTPDERPSIALLLEWAIVEPDLDYVTSTRRFGAPIRWLKRTLVHLLRQYNDQVISQQNRLNVHLMTRVGELDERVADLELRLDDLERRPEP